MKLVILWHVTFSGQLDQKNTEAIECIENVKREQQENDICKWWNIISMIEISIRNYEIMFLNFKKHGTLKLLYCDELFTIFVECQRRRKVE